MKYLYEKTAMDPIIDGLTNRLRDYRNRFSFQGGSKFAVTIADHIDNLEKEINANKRRCKGAGVGVCCCAVQRSSSGKGDPE